MKKLLFILILFSCKKEVQQNVEPALAVQTSEQIAEATGPVLRIPEDEGGWQSPYPSGRMGLFHSFKDIHFTTVNSYFYNAYEGKIPLGTQIKYVSYDCPIANGYPGDTWDTAVNNPITRSGTRDWVTDGGITETPLYITTYANGGVFVGRKKDEFYYLPTDRRTGAPQGINYPGKSFLWWGWLDTYGNSAIIPNVPSGKYVIAVTYDYGKINPTTSLLPIRVEGNTVVTDTTAIYENAALPAGDVKATLQRGKIKGVNISWSGNAYAYCIEKDGVMIVKWADIRTFFDPNGTRFSKYKIISRNQGRIPDNETQEFKPTVK